WRLGCRAGSCPSAGASSARCPRPASGSSPRPGSARRTRAVTTLSSRPAEAAGPSLAPALLPLRRYRYPRAAHLVHQEASPSPVYGAALLMRFGFAAIRGSNPRASAPDQGVRAKARAPWSASVLITAPRWANVGPGRRGIRDDPVNRGPADAGDLVDAVLAHPGGDGPPHAVVTIPRHRHPLHEHLLRPLLHHVQYRTRIMLDVNRGRRDGELVL